MIVRFLTAAEQELRAAAAFYEARLPGLASAFLAEVERMCAMLSEHGVLGRRCDERHRSLRLRRFPFSVIYRVDGGAIEVVAVAHHRRQPEYWSVREEAGTYAVSLAA